MATVTPFPAEHIIDWARAAAPQDRNPFAGTPPRRPWSPHRVVLTYAEIKTMCESNFFTATRSSDPRAVAAARNTLSDVARFSQYTQARELAARFLVLSEPGPGDAA